MKIIFEGLRDAPVIIEGNKEFGEKCLSKVFDIAEELYPELFAKPNENTEKQKR
jgi:TATA-binding protein-associated factor Taf7